MTATNVLYHMSCGSTSTVNGDSSFVLIGQVLTYTHYAIKTADFVNIWLIRLCPRDKPLY